MKNNKKIDLDTLAQMVKRGFDDQREETRTLIRESEKRTAQRIEGVQLRLTAEVSSIHRSVSQMHEKLQDHDERINKIEDEMVA